MECLLWSWQYSQNIFAQWQHYKFKFVLNNLNCVGGKSFWLELYLLSCIQFFGIRIYSNLSYASMWQNVLLMLWHRKLDFFLGGGVWVLILFVIEVWRLIFDNLIFKGGGGMQNILDSMTPPTPPLDWSALVCKPSVWILSSVILDHVGLIRFWCHWGHLHCNRPLTQWMVIQFQNPINLLFQFINAFIG